MGNKDGIRGRNDTHSTAGMTEGGAQSQCRINDFAKGEV